MSEYAIYADKFVLPGHVAGPGYLPIINGTFGFFQTERPAMDIVDKCGMWIAPGLVDTHIHGFHNHATTDADPAGINDSSIALARCGTTSWFPTTFTNSVESIAQEVSAIREAVCERDSTFRGARIPGIFLEGPFFTMKHVGAQNPDYLIDPSYKAFSYWQDRAGGLIRRSALAAERHGAASYVARLTALGIVGAIGHSDATFDQCMAVIDAGATSFVHTYNGMRGLHHREPGVVGAAMVTPHTYAELICDGHHVRPEAAGALIAAKGWQHIVLITDCLGCGGMPEGHYLSDGLPIELRDGACYLTEGPNAGNLAGSIATLAQIVKNVFDWGLVTAEQAIRMATENPARENHVEATCGFIMPYRSADFITLHRDLRLDATYLSGTLIE